jgi:hypothetical protein
MHHSNNGNTTRLQVEDPGGTKSAVATVYCPETADNYPNVVAVLDPQVRVIAADVQWIMQERKGNRWRNKLYFHTKEGLLFYAPKPAAAALAVLPRWFQSHKPKPPALGMPAAATMPSPAPAVAGPVFVKKAVNGFSVADACTGAVIADGIETIDRAEGGRDGFERAQRINRERRRR